MLRILSGTAVPCSFVWCDPCRMLPIPAVSPVHACPAWTSTSPQAEFRSSKALMRVLGRLRSSAVSRKQLELAPRLPRPIARCRWQRWLSGCGASAKLITLKHTLRGQMMHMMMHIMPPGGWTAEICSAIAACSCLLLPAPADGDTCEELASLLRARFGRTLSELNPTGDE